MLVGRQAELARVSELMAGPAPFAVVGEAGVGKTALLREAAAQSGRRLLEAGALGTLSWLPYLPLRRALGDDVAAGDAHYVASRVERRAGDAVLLLDDFHWADRETRELVALLTGRIAVAAALRRGDPATPPVLAGLRDLGFELVELEPLEEADAARLARSANPRLTEPALHRLVGRSGGNPFLIAELATSGDPSESLQLSLAARLRLLSDTGREAMALLSLAGRPLEPGLLGSGAAEIVGAGLARAADVVSVRHALLAEAMVEQLDERERRRLHRRLARALPEPGEAARHHAAARERGKAFAKAMEAVDRAALSGERASHLALAAAVATGPEADVLRLRAAQALLATRDVERVEELLAQVRTEDRGLRAEVWLVRYRVCRARADDEGARAAWNEGARLARGTGAQVEVGLAAEEARLVLHVDRDADRAVEIAEGALDLARRLGLDESPALAVLGAARLCAGVPGWERSFRSTLRRASAEGRSIHGSANMFVFGLIIHGRGSEARLLAEKMARRSRDEREVGSETVFRAWIAEIDLHDGHPGRAAAAAEELLERRPAPMEHRVLQADLAAALSDLGRHKAARAHATELVANAQALRTTEAQAIEAYLALADAEYWAGRLREAVDTVETCFSRFGRRGTYAGSTAFLELLRAWSLFELGEEVAAEPVEPRPPLVAAAPTELEAIALLAAGRDREASDRFARAAAAWRGNYFRGELRCLWASAEALRRAGEVDEARRRLEAVERFADERGYVPMLGKVRRSLRLAGERRSARRASTGHGLTVREMEVLELVGEGLSNAAIARRLGLGRPTVVRLVSSAAQKLGAASRGQAAALVARR